MTYLLKQILRQNVKNNQFHLFFESEFIQISIIFFHNQLLSSNLSVTKQKIKLKKEELTINNSDDIEQNDTPNFLRCK